LVESIKRKYSSNSKLRLDHVYKAESLELTQRFKDECVDLVIYDPDPRVPEEMIKNYLYYNKQRLLEIKRILTKKGFVFVFSEGSLKYQFKLMIDEIFGAANFLQEVVFVPEENFDYLIFNFISILIYSKDNRAKLNTISPIKHKSEYFIYENQKSLSLIKKLIKLGSKKDDLIFDPTCGAGTSLIAAKLLGRKYIGCDINSEAIKITKGRLEGLRK